jgi:hypothetical protein
MRRLLRSSKNTESFDSNLDQSIPVIDVSKISNEESKKQCGGSASHHSADLGKEAEMTEKQW